MHPNIKLARKFSKYYPPVDLPVDKSNWHVGHSCLAVLEDLYPRRDLLITTLLDSYEIDKGQEDIDKLKNDYLALELSKAFKDISKLYMLQAYTSFFWHNFIRNVERLSGKMKRLRKATDKADNILIQARNKFDFFDMIEKEHVCNCGEMGHMTSIVLNANNIPFQSVCLRLKNKEGRLLHDNHCFCLVRTDNKKLTFKQMMAELYHPSTLIVDWWFGRCGHPKEMFDMFSNFFVEDTYDKNKKFISCLKPGTRFLLSSQMDRNDDDNTNANYVVGYVSSKMPRVFCQDKPNIFNPICIPYDEDAIHNQQLITQNQYSR